MQLTGALQTVGTHCIKEALLASLAFLWATEFLLEAEGIT
jgi:hypothetical protein